VFAANTPALAKSLLEQATILTIALATKKNPAEFSVVVSHYLELLKSCEAQGFVIDNPKLKQAAEQRLALAAILYAEAFGSSNRNGSVLEDLYRPALLYKAVEIAFEKVRALRAEEKVTLSNKPK